ncbi:MAG: P27 family phage terminase small subunit [Lachnospiraceae bacterium]|nr:P27 family phage terminase small subunit [Lachnospiraceae bacterium]
MAAKDGSNRGGARPGAGAKRKPLVDKIAEGSANATMLSFPEPAELTGLKMPSPSKFLSAEQRDGSKTEAAKIYKKTWRWLNERGCAAYVSPQLIERYSMAAARWIQVEGIIDEFGFLAKHPTTGAAIASPFVAMSQNYLALADRIWSEIFQIVKENCTVSYDGGTPQDDLMEQLLRRQQT